MARQTNLFDKNGRPRRFNTPGSRNTFPTTTPVPNRGAGATPPNPPRGGFGSPPPRGQLEIRTPVAGGNRQQATLPPGQRGGAIAPNNNGGGLGGGALSQNNGLVKRGGALIPPVPPRGPRRLGAGGGIANNGIIGVNVRDGRMALPPGRPAALPPGQQGGALARNSFPASVRPGSAARPNAATAAAATAAAGERGTAAAVEREAAAAAGGLRGASRLKNSLRLGGRGLGAASTALIAVMDYNDAIAAGYSPEQAAIISAASGGGGWGGFAAGAKAGSKMPGGPIVKGLSTAGFGIAGSMLGSPLASEIARGLVGPPIVAKNDKTAFPVGTSGSTTRPVPVQQSSRGPLTGSMEIIRHPLDPTRDGGMEPTAPPVRAPRPSSQAPINMPPAPQSGGSVFAPQVGQPARPNSPVPSAVASANASAAPSPAASTPAAARSPYAGVGPVDDGARYQAKLNAANAAQHPDAPDLERRRAFLDAKDSMSGAKAVRDLKERRRRLTIELD